MTMCALRAATSLAITGLASSPHSAASARLDPAPVAGSWSSGMRHVTPHSTATVCHRPCCTRSLLTTNPTPHVAMFGPRAHRQHHARPSRPPKLPQKFSHLRFLTKTADYPAPPGFDLPCQLWQGGLDTYDYGSFHNMGTTHDHLCNRTWCTELTHLEPVTNAENQRRKTERTTTCGTGRHPYPGAGNKCKACDAERARQYRMRKKHPPSTQEEPC